MQRIGPVKKQTSVRTRRLASLTVAIVATGVLVMTTLSEAANSWDPVNVLLRIAVFFVAVVAGVRWLTLGGTSDSQEINVNNSAPREEGSVMRSAGSRTILDNLLWLFGRRRTAAQDLVVVSDGGAVMVTGYLMDQKVRRVSLRVGLDEASAESMALVLGAAPYRVFGTQTPTRGLFEKSVFTQINGSSASGGWSIAVPTIDVEVVRYVLQRAGAS